jgi:hypothetical protein
LGETLVQREARRRLWWTLVICEWISIPVRKPCINDVDFNCQLPADINDAQLLESDLGFAPTPAPEPRPVQYHIIMAKVATIHHQLHAKLRLRRWSPSGIADSFRRIISSLTSSTKFHLICEPTTAAIITTRKTSSTFCPGSPTKERVLLWYFFTIESRSIAYCKPIGWKARRISHARGPSASLQRSG